MATFDYAVIGAGPGGYVSAIRAAQLGLKTVLIDRNARLGGTCLNVGCIPSKAMLEASDWFWDVSHKFPEFGVTAQNVNLDLSKMLAKKTEIVNTLTDGIGMLMKKNGVTVMQGEGRLTGKGKVTVVDSKGKKIDDIEAGTIVLAMGSVPVELPFMKFDHKYIVDSTDALEFSTVPRELVVIGAGAVGLELGSVWNRLGAKVTVLEMLPQIAPFADKQLAVTLQKAMTEQGIAFHLSAKVTGASVKNKQVELTVEMNEGKERTESPPSKKAGKGVSQKITASKVLVAVGRRPHSDSAGIAEVGVKIEPNGRIPVDEHYQTNIAGVHALGDLIHGPMLAHKAEDEGVAVAEIAAGKPGHVNYEAIPNVIYTNPELATVGLGEDEAKRRGVKVNVGKFYFRGNGRALSLGEAEGLVKVVADAETDRLLGVHIVGPRASDMIAEAVVAMEFSASAEDLARTVHAHPTLSEALKEAALAVAKRQIHG